MSTCSLITNLRCHCSLSWENAFLLAWQRVAGEDVSFIFSCQVDGKPVPETVLQPRAHRSHSSIPHCQPQWDSRGSNAGGALLAGSRGERSSRGGRVRPGATAAGPTHRAPDAQLPPAATAALAGKGVAAQAAASASAVAAAAGAAAAEGGGSAAGCSSQVTPGSTCHTSLIAHAGSSAAAIATPLGSAGSGALQGSIPACSAAAGPGDRTPLGPVQPAVPYGLSLPSQGPSPPGIGRQAKGGGSGQHLGVGSMWVAAGAGGGGHTEGPPTKRRAGGGGSVGDGG